TSARATTSWPAAAASSATRSPERSSRAPAAPLSEQVRMAMRAIEEMVAQPGRGGPAIARTGAIYQRGSIDSRLLAGLASGGGGKLGKRGGGPPKTRRRGALSGAGV